MSEIQDMVKQIEFNNLTYYFLGSNVSAISFIRFKDPKHIYNNIKNGKTSIWKIEQDQEQFKSDLNEITRGNSKRNQQIKWKQ